MSCTRSKPVSSRDIHKQHGNGSKPFVTEGTFEVSFVELDEDSNGVVAPADSVHFGPFSLIFFTFRDTKRSTSLRFRECLGGPLPFASAIVELEERALRSLFVSSASRCLSSASTSMRTLTTVLGEGSDETSYKTTDLSPTQEHACAFLPNSNQLSSAKFTLSAQLKPKLNPA